MAITNTSSELVQKYLASSHHSSTFNSRVKFVNDPLTNAGIHSLLKHVNPSMSITKESVPFIRHMMKCVDVNVNGMIPKEDVIKYIVTTLPHSIIDELLNEYICSNYKHQYVTGCIISNLLRNAIMYTKKCNRSTITYRDIIIGIINDQRIYGILSDSLPFFVNKFHVHDRFIDIWNKVKKLRIPKVNFGKVEGIKLTKDFRDGLYDFLGGVVLTHCFKSDDELQAMSVNISNMHVLGYMSDPNYTINMVCKNTSRKYIMLLQHSIVSAVLVYSINLQPSGKLLYSTLIQSILSNECMKCIDIPACISIVSTITKLSNDLTPSQELIDFVKINRVKKSKRVDKYKSPINVIIPAPSKYF